jgi:hypothetical protein
MALARKSKAPVGSPTEASDVFFASCCLALAHLSAGGRPMEFGKLGRVAYLRDDPRFRAKSSRGLFYDAPADWCRPKGDRVTRLRHSNEVLPPVLAEEKPFFALEQACQVQAAYRHIDLQFHLLCFLSGLTFTFAHRLMIAR